MSNAVGSIQAENVQVPANGGRNGAARVSETDCPEWSQLIPPQEWEVYLAAIHAVRQTRVRFLLGGAFGLAAYTGRWRNTKDIDFFVLPSDREATIQALTEIGFRDYYETLPYDRGWIYRATRDEVIVDIIWGTPNRRTEVDEQWFEYATTVWLRDQLLEVLPAEELVWIKLYVLQRDRCDWPDLINLLYATSATLDWERLTARLGPDLPLLRGLLCVFMWVCPDRIESIPAKLRRGLGATKRKRPSSGPDSDRVRLVDSRPWFAAFQPSDRPMQL